MDRRGWDAVASRAKKHDQVVPEGEVEALCGPGKALARSTARVSDLGGPLATTTQPAAWALRHKNRSKIGALGGTRCNATLNEACRGTRAIAFLHPCSDPGSQKVVLDAGASCCACPRADWDLL